MKKLWNWICSFFTKENVGIIWRVLFTTAKESVKNTIHDPAIQRKAFDLAKSLMNKDMSGDEKKDLFNDAMKEYLKGIGAEIGTSTLNTIRELALDAAKKSCGDGGCTDGSCSDGSCVVKSVVMFLAAGLMALGAMAETQVFELKGGKNYGKFGRMTGWEAYSTNKTATVTLDKVLDLYVKEVGTVIVTNMKERVTYEPRAVIVTNGVSYTYSNPTTNIESIVTNGGYTVWTNGQLQVVGASVTTNFVYSTTNAVYNISTNYLPSMVVTKVPVASSATVTRMVLAMSVTNNLVNSSLTNGFKSGGQSANIAPSEYLVVGGQLAEDQQGRFVLFMGNDAGQNATTENNN